MHMQFNNLWPLKRNAYKYFQISNRNLRNNLALKDKNAQH